MPGCAKVRHRLGLAYLRKRRLEDAARCFEAGLSDLRKRARNLFLVGRARELAGDLQAAQLRYREARAELEARAQDLRAFRLWLQVEHHLGGHLDRLPESDSRSRAILEQMRDDEIRHGDAAREAGGMPLPAPVRALMRGASRVMTTAAYRI